LTLLFYRSPERDALWTLRHEQDAGASRGCSRQRRRKNKETGMQSIIKPYEEQYREQMIAVWEKSVCATHHFVSSEELDKLKELVKQIDFHSFAVYCLLSESKVLGFVGVEDDVIESLFLDPEYMGQKLGTKLMNFALTELKADKVNVNEENLDAIKFYSKFGFVTYERTEKDAYGNDYPILKMKINR
jgi:putative acetyltransferase